MKRSLKDIVVILKTINACLILVGWWLSTTVTQAVNPQTWLMTETDSLRPLQCVTGSAGNVSAIVCSHVCCFQPGECFFPKCDVDNKCSLSVCIGMFFNELTSECLVINTTEKAEPCDDLNWANWTPYRKSKVSTDACSDYLKHSGGYAFTHDYFGEAVASVHVADLYYTPASSGEVGGYTLIHPHTEVIFEGNVIPDAGNEVVENMFDAPVTAKCFTLLDNDYHVNRVIRWDLIGCADVL